MSKDMTPTTRAQLDDETRAWIAYYNAQAKLFAELAAGTASSEQVRNYRAQEKSWREKARALLPVAAE
ncbi:hypothetical protein IZ6_13770 [Terrihabitans soli]|uniref:Uncharacterized protein n=1 Tax=Terrihabitans soli TaxID=708113 RepID=A0A6S6QTQ4_9HYPH|nr:hypothetical protein [Terrihabitans soli]BCJ90642.1 hypothetical protein IZ6_13770 [Terrihabitans soli]